jgi:hypothetical protein
MTCEKCGKEMIFQYDVEERNVLFVLWDCECGHKFLERRPQVGKALVAALAASPSVVRAR